MDPINNDPDVQNFIDTQEDIHEILQDYDDVSILDHLAHYAASILAQYEEGEDRDNMIELFANSVEDNVELFDETEIENEEPAIGEILDVVADKLYMSLPVGSLGFDHLEHRDAYRAFVNEAFGLDLPLYRDADDLVDDVCTDCGCAISD